MNNQEIKIGQVWQHFKGNHYKILGIGNHTETGEKLVAYQDMSDNIVWMRPLSMFFDEVLWQGNKTQRFVLIS